MGIPVDLIPFTSDDVVQTENHHNWLQFRIRQEQMQQQQQQQQQKEQELNGSTRSGILPKTDSDMMDDDDGDS